MKRWAFTQNGSHNQTAVLNLLSAIHHFNRRLNRLDFIHGVFQVNVLPVLTVCDPVTPALPVSSDPGEKHRLPSLTCIAESGQWERIQKHIKPDILRFYETFIFFPPHTRWIAFEI